MRVGEGMKKLRFMTREVRAGRTLVRCRLVEKRITKC
jgi:hypothetical protein